MAVHQTSGHRWSLHLPAPRRAAAVTGEAAAADAAVAALPRTLAAVRLLMAGVFLWAFFDKTFGWNYATGSERAWINGGSPTEGYLGNVSAGPLESAFHSMAGAAWADVLFMLGLLGIGLALLGGIGLRVAAAGGTVMMAMMWAADWPPARFGSDGAPTMSTNPLLDYHLLYAAVLILLAVAGAGRHWGGGTRWARLPLVRRFPWLR